MSNRKRPRSVREENQAECPFKISYVKAPSRAEQERHNNKRWKRVGQDDDKAAQIQKSPFSPTGSFKTYDTMDLDYTVEPWKRWQTMTRYNSFILNDIKYYSGGFVNVANEVSINNQNSHSGDKLRDSKRNDDWVALILGIRASDKHHVYACVYWMYRPDELPPGTLDGNRYVQGRQSYHGAHELIASNHMDIINVISVTGLVAVNHWDELNGEEIQDALYWRQAYDCRNSELSSVKLLCKCETPANPDKTLIRCTILRCREWMHYECMVHDVLMKVYERLGTDKPHKIEGSVAKEEKPEDATRFLSPACTVERETQPLTIVRYRGTQDDFYAENGVHETSREIETPTSGLTTSRFVTATSAKGLAKRGRKKEMAKSRPYTGLFEASLEMQDGPIAWKINDLRGYVTGGEKTWAEKAHCLLCGTIQNLLD